MITFRYHKDFPQGKKFDTEGRQFPVPPSELNGWFDTPAKLHITQDQLIAAVVKQELAKQGSDRTELDREFEKKTGEVPHFAAKEETLVKVLDTPGVVKRGPGRPRKVA